MRKNPVNKPDSSRSLLSKIWGDRNSIPQNIAALSVILLLLGGMLYTFFHPDHKLHPDSLSVRDMWTIITPLVTALFGYLFWGFRKPDCLPHAEE